jgi:cobalt-zinc-cadmium efflux system outer membrane protein
MEGACDNINRDQAHLKWTAEFALWGGIEMILRFGAACRVFFWIAATLPPIQNASAQVELGARRNEIGASTGLQADDRKENHLIRLEDLISELRKVNPDLAAARKQFEAALTRPAQAGTPPDPKVTIGWISNGYPWPGAGLGSTPTSNIGFQIAQEFPYPGKLALKSGIAQKEADSAAQMYRAKELALIAQLKDRYYELGFVYEAMELLHSDQLLLQQLAAAANARYVSGKAMQQDVIKAEIEISILETRLTLLEQKQRTITSEINSILNRPTDGPLGKPEPVRAIPTLAPLSSMQTAAGQASPLVRAQQSVIDSRQLSLQEAHKAYYPDFEVMSGYYNQGAMKPMWEFKVQVNIPLFYRHKKRLGLERAGVQLAEAQHTYRSIQQDLNYRISERYLAAEAAHKLFDLYSMQIIPQSKLALESSLASYETGGVDFLTVLANLTTIREYQIGYCEQQAAYLKALAGLEELTASAEFAMESKDAVNSKHDVTFNEGKR